MEKAIVTREEFMKYLVIIINLVFVLISYKYAEAKTYVATEESVTCAQMGVAELVFNNHFLNLIFWHGRQV